MYAQVDLGEASFADEPDKSIVSKLLIDAVTQCVLSSYSKNLRTFQNRDGHNMSPDTILQVDIISIDKTAYSNLEILICNDTNAI